ncbi:MAG: sigma-70 family RNA polymerase sigma factor [Planctomycetia bacterium]|nr:sigma-70 family RNA polymerase sigma factor [Planctomycetia bacterium]
MIDVQQAGRDYMARIYRAALVLTGDPWEADDLTQEVFLVLAERGDSFQGRSQVYTWLYGVLLNLERTRRRRNDVRRRGLRVLWAQDAQARRTVPAAEAPLEAAEWKRSLWAGVARLSDGQRQTLVLRFSEHLSYEEIAAVMNCPLGTVKSRIFNGLAALKNEFGADESAAATLPVNPRPLTDAV